jgi:transcriptional regulator with XRE-family HTH domain
MREAREAKGLTQDELGQMVGRTRESINRWENRKSAPRMGPALRALARALDVELLWLIKGKGPRDVQHDHAAAAGAAG